VFGAPVQPHGGSKLRNPSIQPACVNPRRLTDKPKGATMFKPKANAILGTTGGRLMRSGLRRRALIGLLVLPGLTLPMQAAANTRLHFKGRETGTFQMLGPCETGGVILEVTGTGHTTHLGNYSGNYRECLDPATGAVTAGTFTLTAANGDKVFGTYSGRALPTDNPNVVAYQDPGVITGGTGRFASASGTLTTSGLADLATGEYEGKVVGSVSRRTSG
jgi:hypothetical protein